VAGAARVTYLECTIMVIAALLMGGLPRGTRTGRAYPAIAQNLPPPV
jgi:hypothetical protein